MTDRRRCTRSMSVQSRLMTKPGAWSPRRPSRPALRSIRICRRTCLASVDPRRLRQILLNLLSNAVKFTPSGGSVTFRRGLTADGSSIVDCRHRHRHRQRRHPKALERFGQVDSRLSRSYEGTGLGLPLAKQLTELHGGTLELESTVGVGTTVTAHASRRSASFRTLRGEGHRGLTGTTRIFRGFRSISPREVGAGAAVANPVRSGRKQP